jgi:addiction module RelE/StbE family toxin
VANVVLAKRARTELLALDWPLIDAVTDAVGLLARAPDSGQDSGHELRGRLRGLRALRVGSYRIIYQLSDDHNTLRIATIRHRSTAYHTDPR